MLINNNKRGYNKIFAKLEAHSHSLETFLTLAVALVSLTFMAFAFSITWALEKGHKDMGLPLFGGESLTDFGAVSAVVH